MCSLLSPTPRFTPVFTFGDWSINFAMTVGSFGPPLDISLIFALDLITPFPTMKCSVSFPISFNRYVQLIRLTLSVCDSHPCMHTFDEFGLSLHLCFARSTCFFSYSESNSTLMAPGFPSRALAHSTITMVTPTWSTLVNRSFTFDSRHPKHNHRYVWSEFLCGDFIKYSVHVTLDP